jgi:hypothetical protein
MVAALGPLLDELYKIHACIGGAGDGLRMGDSQLVEVLGARPARQPHHGVSKVMRDGNGNRLVG